MAVMKTVEILSESSKSFEDAMENAGHYLEQAAESFARAWK